jgi:hypothetical protein
MGRREQFTRTLKDGRVVTARTNGGIRKRCGCPWKSWQRCAHPWHANYSFNGREYRVSLHKWAKKQADYVMLETEAKSLFSRWKTAIEDGEVKTAKEVKAESLTLDAIAKTYIKNMRITLIDGSAQPRTWRRKLIGCAPR